MSEKNYLDSIFLKDARETMPRSGHGEEFGIYYLKNSFLPCAEHASTQTGETEGSSGQSRDADHKREEEDRGVFDQYIRSASIHGLAQTTGPQFYVFRR